MIRKRGNISPHGIPRSLKHTWGGEKYASIENLRTVGFAMYSRLEVATRSGWVHALKKLSEIYPCRTVLSRCKNLHECKSMQSILTAHQARERRKKDGVRSRQK